MLGVAVAGGCRTTEAFDAPPSALVDASTPLAVTLSNELRRLSAKTEIAGAKFRFRVGNLLTGLFRSEDGLAFLSLVDSKLELEGIPQSWRARYDLVLALQCEGSYHLVQCAGTGDSNESPKNAGRMAIERCAEDLYERVAVLVRR